ncbi:hypothetical protein EUX98_g2720 [Antrodiella citrinella]|uniref:Protein kinase domain-containing protein n=1 Tax=Antrodiella citrinella TaxID=2447956 RepID=A0A4S4N6L2_9APHY|nr:hypothetical protein EUX98_g2720 [Antrodiella citrinella]
MLPRYLLNLQGDIVSRVLDVCMDPLLLDIALQVPDTCRWYEASDKMTQASKRCVIKAYEKLHSRGILHGSVMFENILMSTGDRVTLMDFSCGRAIVPNGVVDSATESELAEEMRLIKRILAYDDGLQTEVLDCAHHAQERRGDSPNLKRYMLEDWEYAQEMESRVVHTIPQTDAYGTPVIHYVTRRWHTAERAKQLKRSLDVCRTLRSGQAIWRQFGTMASILPSALRSQSQQPLGVATDVFSLHNSTDNTISYSILPRAEMSPAKLSSSSSTPPLVEPSKKQVYTKLDKHWDDLRISVILCVAACHLPNHAPETLNPDMPPPALPAHVDEQQVEEEDTMQSVDAGEEQLSRISSRKPSSSSNLSTSTVYIPEIVLPRPRAMAEVGRAALDYAEAYRIEDDEDDDVPTSTNLNAQTPSVASTSSSVVSQASQRLPVTSVGRGTKRPSGEEALAARKRRRMTMNDTDQHEKVQSTEDIDKVLTINEPASDAMDVDEPSFVATLHLEIPTDIVPSTATTTTRTVVPPITTIPTSTTAPSTTVTIATAPVIATRAVFNRSSARTVSTRSYACTDPTATTSTAVNSSPAKRPVASEYTPPTKLTVKFSEMYKSSGWQDGRRSRAKAQSKTPRARLSGRRSADDAKEEKEVENMLREFRSWHDVPQQEAKDRLKVEARAHRAGWAFSLFSLTR